MFPAITVVCCLAALTLLGIAAWTDRKYRLIANRVSVMTGISGLVWLLAATANDPEFQFLNHITAAALIFAIGFGLWLVKVFGGGDVKLLTSAALWAGMSNLAPMIMIVTVAGAALALMQVFLGKFLPSTAAQIFGGCASQMVPVTETGPAGDDDGPTEPAPITDMSNTVPYGIAIAIGGAWAVKEILFSHGIY